MSEDRPPALLADVKKNGAGEEEIGQVLSLDADQVAVAETEVDPTPVQIVKRGPIDVPLLVVTLGLTLLGVVMIYSASSVVALHRYGDPTYFLHRQLGGVAVGIVALVVGMRLDYRWYRRLVYPILAGSFLVLGLVLLPGLGVAAGGARRWLALAGLRIQPAELVKVTAIIYLAYSISKKEKRMRFFSLAFIPHVAVIGGLVLFLLPQPDFGTVAILMAILGIMLFIGGARISYLVALAGAAGFVVYDAVVSSPYRLQRIQVFLNPESHRQGTGWQITESRIALGSGGITGTGLGEGPLKLGYVPELWNDFIGTIIGHELGLLGMGLVIVLFLVFLWRAVRIAYRANDPFGGYLAFGLASLLTLQAGTNLGVVTGLLPTKGLTLPFVSYGRSSIVVCLFVVGVLQNIAQNNEDTWAQTSALRAEAKARRKLKRKRDQVRASRVEKEAGGLLMGLD
ncbi:MAG: putative lipid II flippase FtsW [Bradymonadales bacterium]|nr:putative lipid II flippase FtsW [Bradymonadales bacterium]